MRLTIILGAIICLCLSSTIIVAISLSKHGCPEKCGNVTIPYPFGIGSECSGNSSFTVICQNSTTPILSRINMEALYISLQGMIRVKQPVSPMTCSNVTKTHSILAASLVGSPFTISTLNNSLVNLGCSNAVWLRANKTTTIGGCMAICDANARDTSCNGVNCCQITVPPRLKELQYTYQSVQDTNNSFPCGYAFLVDKKWFRKDYKRYKGLQNNLLNPFDQEFRSAPLILEWEWEIDIQVLETTVGVRCSDPRASESAKAILNYCGLNLPFNYRYLVPNEIDVQPAINYCYCADGYEGNPYLPGGCRYIYECSNATLNGCPDGRYYINKMGYYCCLDTSRTSHKSNSKKRSRVKIIVISTTFSVLGAIILVVGAWRSIKAIKALTKRIKANRRRKFFKRNGGLLLQQHLSSSDKHGVERTKLFSSKELARATDRYSENRILGRGGQGTVYKGMLTDGKIVAVKKPNDKVHEGDVEIFINEVVILSQINHRNVVRLLGCCLETQVPLLVYEFITNGTLFQHIHHPDEEFFPLSWEVRLRIARDIAGALSYMHSAAYAPIYHRDIKSTNILLDEKYRAKVSDFGTSRTVSIDQTHLTTRVLGTFGYLDPEYFQSSQFTEKSDVYSFGVVMVELLTGEKAISSIRADSGKSLATHFLHSMEEDILFDIVDARVLKQGTREEIMAFAQVARSCLHLNGKRRPTMKEVAYELEGVQLILKETDSSQNNCVQDHDYILSEQHATEIAEWGDDFCSISGR